MLLSGRTALVTGSTQGIGKAIAIRMADEGANVVVSGRSEERGKAVAASIEDAGGRALFVRCDVGVEEDLRGAVEAAVAEFGGLTDLINNAAPTQEVTTGGDGSVLDLTTEKWDRMIRIGLTSSFWSCKYAVPHMLTAGHGSIVNIVTVSAIRGEGGMDGYTAGKGGLLSLTRSLAVEFGPRNIRANAIAPGYVPGDMPASRVILDEPFLTQAWKNAQVLPQWGEPADVAAATAFLASDQASSSPAWSYRSTAAAPATHACPTFRTQTSWPTSWRPRRSTHCPDISEENMTSTAEMFGPLAEPIHPDAAGLGDLPWRDNAYLAFWSTAAPVCGEVHVSTSPNAEGRRARIEVIVDDRCTELIEPLDPGTFTSESIQFGTDGHIIVDSQGIGADLRYTPRFSPCNYGTSNVLGGLKPDNPLLHYQQGVDLRGHVRVGEHTVPVEGRAFRDRTWGFRDETKQWLEYVAVWACFDEFDLTVMKILGPDQKPRFAGFMLDDTGAREIDSMRICWDPAGLFAQAVLGINGEERLLRVTERLTNGLWQPLGPQREGPQVATYVEFPTLEAWGHPGRGLSGYGNVRTLW